MLQQILYRTKQLFFLVKNFSCNFNAAKFHRLLRRIIPEQSAKNHLNNMLNGAHASLRQSASDWWISESLVFAGQLPASVDQRLDRQTYLIGHRNVLGRWIATATDQLMPGMFTRGRRSCVITTRPRRCRLASTWLSRLQTFTFIIIVSLLICFVLDFAWLLINSENRYFITQ